MQVDRLSKEELQLLIEGLDNTPSVSKEQTHNMLESFLPLLFKEPSEATKDEIKIAGESLKKKTESRNEEISLLKAKLIKAKRDLA